METDVEEVGSPTLEGVMDDTPDTEHFWEVDTVIAVDAEEEVECVKKDTDVGTDLAFFCVWISNTSKSITW